MVLCVLFLALVSLQLVVGDRLQAGHAERVAKIEWMLDSNRSVLQDMTDAETGVRGFQLTADRDYLQPYESGRRGAFVELDRLAARAGDAGIIDLVRAERAAAEQWLYAYGIPIVNAGIVDTDADRAARGRVLFDDVRTANAAVTAAVNAEHERMVAADRSTTNRVQLLFAGLAVLVLITGLGLAFLHQRHLLQPVEHIRHTLRRLAEGERGARAEETGPAEMRAVIGTLNDLAGEIERLLTAEQARVSTGELRQRVAAELRTKRADPAETGRRLARMIGAALGAEAVYGRCTVFRGATFAVSWPESAPELDRELVRRIRAGRPGQACDVPGLPGGLAVPLSGDDDCPPGLVLVLRPDRPEWTEDERSALAGIGREIDHSLHQQRFQLRQSRLISELRVLDEQKDVFVSTVTHELRTPLTSILGYTEMLSDAEPGELTPIQERSLAAILRNAHRLQATVADLLLLDRDNEWIGAEPAPVDLAAMVTAVHDEVAAAAGAKNVESVLEVDEAWVRGDGVQLERALRKLVDNAIKFTPSGGRFELRLTVDGPNAVVTVTDTGMGIPADDLSGLFTPFHRAANAMDQAVQGPGLGLAIVRNIVSEHGGTVSVRSEVGHGSTFTVLLPALVTAEANS
ncbi:ATP-binding protein [Paractinoplanes toevensis]|uniref:ATP-binding protein n=1 Tax=Paractinoplanes toevensis TaxID=571911 RepID=UPI001FECE0CF|nr:ATP-binding protein [Actinoplanes toevensis]